MSLVLDKPDDFIHILRIQNTNVNGKHKVMYALRAIKGIGRRYSNLLLKIAQIDLNKRAGELTTDEVEKINDIMSRPTDFNIPRWFLNRQRDPRDGTFTQLISVGLDTKLREDLERMKKVRKHRGLRHYWGLRVKGQHTKSTGRTGRTLGVTKKK
eukprot:NODE_5174_length_596_cov_51.032907_g4475_i0.p1 GENE.NODE_5174_length_596_cov_51.032907_g4475_i0~~NODE_5174_length_596_cov_51.032907_g4475_i0.p1  ORF type:complete len:155 (+),score=24.98 NODE_5174_length_596_cov_51.032907_g4475_i0:63-527(+)